MNEQQFVNAGVAAGLALVGRRARSLVTGRVGEVTGVRASMVNGRLSGSQIELQTDAGLETLANIEQLVFLEGNAQGELPAIAAPAPEEGMANVCRPGEQ